MLAHFFESVECHQTFQRFDKHEVRRSLAFLFAYVDDELVTSASAEKYTTSSFASFSSDRVPWTSINASKCVFSTTQLEFFRNIISKDGIRPLSAKVKAVVDFPQTTSQRKLRELLGPLNLHRRFIPQCAEVELPPTDLFRESTEASAGHEWDDAATVALLSAEQGLADAPLLFFPNHDTPTTAMIDASSNALGTVLQQRV